LLSGAGAEVQVVMTGAAARFVGPDTFAALSGRPVYTELWDDPGSVLHVRLADDLLTSTLLEARCPLVVAPAMHTGMWEQPATRANVATLLERGVRVVGPATGPLAHGDEGVGRLAEPEEILAAVEEAAAHGRDLAGRRLVVTAGPTWEPIDPVRF